MNLLKTLPRHSYTREKRLWRDSAQRDSTPSQCPYLFAVTCPVGAIRSVATCSNSHLVTHQSTLIITRLPTRRSDWERDLYFLSVLCKPYQLLKHATFKSGPKTCVIRHHPLWCGNQCKHEVLMNGIYSETGWFDTLNPSHTLLRYLSGWTKTGTGPLATERPKDDILLGSKVLVQ